MLWSLFYYRVRREAFLFSYPLIKWTKNTSIALIAQLRSYTHSGKGSHKTNWLVLCVMSKAWQVYGIWQSSKKWNKQQTGMWITLQICLLYISGFFFFFFNFTNLNKEWTTWKSGLLPEIMRNNFTCPWLLNTASCVCIFFFLFLRAVICLSSEQQLLVFHICRIKNQ